MADVLTVREAVRRAREEGLPVSEYGLRQWLRIGAVPSRKIGSKALVYYPALSAYLRCADADGATQEETAEPTGIRRADQ